VFVHLSRDLPRSRLKHRHGLGNCAVTSGLFCTTCPTDGSESHEVAPKNNRGRPLSVKPNDIWTGYEETNLPH